MDSVLTEAQRWLAAHGFADAGEYDNDEVADLMEALLLDDPRATLEHAEGFPWPFRWIFRDASAIALWGDNWECELCCEACSQYSSRPAMEICPHCGGLLQVRLTI